MTFGPMWPLQAPPTAHVREDRIDLYNPSSGIWTPFQRCSMHRPKLYLEGVADTPKHASDPRCQDCKSFVREAWCRDGLCKSPGFGKLPPATSDPWRPCLPRLAKDLTNSATRRHLLKGRPRVFDQLGQFVRENCKATCSHSFVDSNLDAHPHYVCLGRSCPLQPEFRAGESNVTFVFGRPCTHSFLRLQLWVVYQTRPLLFY